MILSVNFLNIQMKNNLLLVLLFPCFLIAMDQDKSSVDEEFHFAIGKSDLPKVRALFVEKGASLSKLTYDATPLMHAASIPGNSWIISYLLINGAAINQLNDAGNNALFYAARQSDTKIAKLLIAAGIDVNHQDKNGRTALIIRIASGESLEHWLPILRDANADFDIQDDAGDTAIIWAVLKENTQALQELIAAGAKLFIKNRNQKTAWDIARSYNEKALEVFINHKQHQC